MSRLLLLTSLPLSKIIGFLPLSNKVRAAKSPAGPEPMIITSSELETSL